MAALEFTIYPSAGASLAVWGDAGRSEDERVNSDPTHPELFWSITTAAMTVKAKCLRGDGPTDAQLDVGGIGTDFFQHRFAWAWASQPIPYAPVTLTSPGGTSAQVSFTLPNILHAGTWRLRCSLLNASGVLVRAKILPMSLEYRP